MLTPNWRAGLVLVVVLLFVAFGLYGCRATAERTASSTNTEVSVAVLTTFDGITLYRVLDGSSRTVYVAVSGANRVALNTYETHHESCGKGCAREVETQVLGVRR